MPLADPPVLRLFTGLCAAGLAAAPVLLAVLGARGRDVGAAWRSYRGWCLMVPAFLAALWLGRGATLALFGVLSLLAFKELARASGLYRDAPMTLAGYAGIAGVLAACWLPDPATGAPGWLGLFLAMPVFTVALVLLVPVLRDRTDGQLQAMALALTGFVTTGWMLGHLAFLANVPHAHGYLLFLVVAVQANDIAAFVCGRWFGRTPLRPHISPNKTLEGALGALAVSLVVPFALRFALPHFGTAELLVCGLVVGVGGQLGDLSVSVIKRDLGVKDLGALIPGHGGVLDRLDSLVFTAPLFFHLVHYRFDVRGVVA